MESKEQARQAALLLSVCFRPKPEAATLVAALCERGVPVDIADSSGFTALALAARAGCAPVVQELLARGARWDLATTEHGNPPIFWAAANGAFEVIAILLSARASAQ